MFKQWSKKFLIIALELVMISGALWYLIEKKGFNNAYQKVQQVVDQKIEQETQKPFPIEAESVKKTYSWQYKGATYKLNENLYKSSYDFYRSEPKKFSYTGQLPADWEDKFFALFLKIPAEDQTFKKIATDLQSLGKQHDLSDDQIVELTLSFVQSIPYDDAKAKEILSKTGNASVRYPYEVLYENLGVCSDKSILASVLLRQMGYGTSLFAYDDDNHMALGIECPKNSSTYGSGYCYAETTAVGNKIGIIPNIDQTSNKTVGAGELSSFDLNNTQQNNLKQLGQVTIFQETSGRLYGGLAATEKTIAEISQLKKQIDSLLVLLNSLKKTVSEEDSELKAMQNDLEKYQKSQNIEKYNALVEKYNDLLETYQKDAKKYNSKVTLYNQTIARYNLLIKQ